MYPFKFNTAYAPDRLVVVNLAHFVDFQKHPEPIKRERHTEVAIKKYGLHYLVGGALTMNSIEPYNQGDDCPGSTVYELTPEATERLEAILESFYNLGRPKDV